MFPFLVGKYESPTKWKKISKDKVPIFKIILSIIWLSQFIFHFEIAQFFHYFVTTKLNLVDTIK